MRTNERTIRLQKMPDKMHAMIKKAANDKGITMRKYVMDIITECVDEFPEHLRKPCEPYKASRCSIEVQNVPAYIKREFENISYNTGISMIDLVISGAIKKENRL